MKYLRAFGALALVTFAVAACDDDTTGVEIADLAGTWTATQFEYTDTSGRTPAPSIDAIAAGGSVILTVEEDGTFSGSIAVPGLTGDTPIPLSGDIAIMDDQLTIDFDATTEAIICPTPEQCLFTDLVAIYTLDGNTLVFVVEDTTFDFPDALEETVGLDPAGEVAATLTVTLGR